MNNNPHYSWSYSSLGLMRCPKQYELVRAKKIVQSQSSAAGDEGSRIHSLIEHYFNTGEMSDELFSSRRLFETYYAKGGKPEVEYAFKWIPYEGSNADQAYYQESTNQVLVRCEMNDPDVWYRGIIDWLKLDFDKYEAEVADWKSGRVKPSKQLRLYAWIIFLAHPEIKKVKCTFHWFNHNDQLPEWYERKDFESGKLFEPFKEILDQINVCYTRDSWIPIPGDLNKYTKRGNNCTFCPVTEEHCQYGIKISRPASGSI